MSRQPRRSSLLRVAGFALLLGAAACGARTSLDALLPASSGSASARGTDAGEPPHDARTGSSVGDGGFSDDAGCGAPWVVFVLASDSFQAATVLYALRADGSDGHMIPLPNVDPSFPWVSADGASLVYTTQSGGELYLHRFASGADLVLAHPSGVVTGFAALSPDGTGIAYSTNVGLLYAPLTKSGAGVATLLISVDALGGSPSFPSFTPGGGQVVFGTHDAVGEVSIDGTGAQRLLANPEGFTGADSACLSPDGQTLIAGAACPLGSYSLQAYPLRALPSTPCGSGTIVAALDAPGAVPFYPAWGPTNLIAYWNGRNDIMLVPSEGGAPRNLTEALTAGGGMATMPAWAPSCTSL